MNNRLKILITASEASPFVMTGGLGEVAGALPEALATVKRGKGYPKPDVRVILPYYSKIKEKYQSQLTDLGHFYVQLSWRNQYCGVFTCKHGNVTYYFIDNEYYFKRGTIYGHYDDGERFAFFSKAVLETLKFIDFQPDLIHANDWQTALVPVYLKVYYKKEPFYNEIKTMFTIHNIQYQGVFDKGIMEDVLDIPSEYKSILEYDGMANLMKGAILCADQIGTVSPTYAEEIQDGYYAHGLDWILRDNSYKLKGILNGIDVVSYNPETDRSLLQNFTAENPEGKKADKPDLQKTFGLPVREDVPVIGMVTRLVAHKGLDLITFIFDELMQQEVQLVLLGTGDFAYEDYFYKKAQEYKDKFSIIIDFNMEISRKVYGGADFFLMPSKSEPCGLAQMIALRYGTVPVVRQTGGLKDSIVDYGDPGGTGFTFKTYNAHDMLGAIKRGLDLYKNEAGEWDALVVHNLKQDFSWNRSADEYMELYEKIVKA